MVKDLSAVKDEVQVALRTSRECFEENGGELHVPRAQLRAGRKGHLPDEMRAARQVERARGAGFVHRQRRPPVPDEARLVADGLRHRLADDEPHVLRRVMPVDLDVAGGTDLQVDEPVTRELFDHVRQKR